MAKLLGFDSKNGRTPRRRAGRDRMLRDALWIQPTIRRLEPRRVLNASVQALIVPQVATEGSTVVVSAQGTGEGDLQFDWTVSNENGFVAEGIGESFEFVAPEDGAYSVGVELTDATHDSDVATATLKVSNVAPIIQDFAVSAADSYGYATVSGKVYEPGADDTVTLTVDWGDPSIENESLELGSGLNEFSFLHHISTGEDGEPLPYEIMLHVSDSDGGQQTVTADGTTEPEFNGLVLESVEDIIENDTATLNFSFDGFPDSEGESSNGLTPVRTFTIDWGDGLPPSEIQDLNLEPGPVSFSVGHRYQDDLPTGPDQFVITVTTTDTFGSLDQEQTNVIVENDAPIIDPIGPLPMIIENDIAELVVSFADAGQLDEHTVTIGWGDGLVTEQTLPINARNGVFTHRYQDDMPTGLAEDPYTITVTVTDDDSGSDTQETSILVKNDAPVIDPIGPLAMIVENDTAELVFSFSDPGQLDVHTVLIDWGDGLTTEQTLDVNARNGVFTHRYQDDNPSGTSEDTYDISVTVTDDDGGSDTQETSILVKNDTPVIDPISPLSMIVENDTAELVFSFSDPGQLDVHTVLIDWGDGLTTEQTLDVNARNGVFTHRYQDDNPSGTSEDTYDISVTVTDDDGGSDTQETSILVKNDTPVIDPISPLAMISENGVAELVVSFADAGQIDEHTISIDWGDGNVTTHDVAIGARNGVFTHNYLDDDPSGTPQDTYIIEVTVTDDDSGESGKQTTSILVKNVDPQIIEFDFTNTLISTGGISMIVEVGDVGPDTFNYEVDWGDGAGFVPETPSHSGYDMSGSFLAVQTAGLSHVYSTDFLVAQAATSSPIEGVLRIFDDDTGFVDQPFEVSTEGIAIGPPVVPPVLPPVLPPGISASSGPGIGNHEFQLASVPQNGSVLITLTVPDIRVIQEELARSVGTYFALRVIHQDGTLGEEIRVDADVLYDLDAFFRKLPDNDYELVLINPETKHERTVLKATVRLNQAVDPTDTSDGAQEKPPGSEGREEEEEDEDAIPQLEEVELDWIDFENNEFGPAAQWPADTSAPPVATQLSPRFWEELGATDNDGPSALGPLATAVCATVAVSQTNWKRDIQHALSIADVRNWRRLGSAARIRRRYFGSNDRANDTLD